MQYNLVEKLKLSGDPVAILLAERKPDNAIESKTGNCLMPLFFAAVKGKTAVFSKDTVRCKGGKVGLGLGHFPNYPGGIEYFLSTGKENLFEGEGYRKTPEFGKAFVEQLPITEIAAPYLVFKPLSKVNLEEETPVLISFYVNTNQLSALTVLANYDKGSVDNVRIPSVSGCQALFLLPYFESKQDSPKAVVGMVDISVRSIADANKLTFTVPYQMFLQMEENTLSSFLGKSIWTDIQRKY